MKGYEGFVKAANDATKARNQAIIERQLEHGKLEGFTLEEKIGLNETIKVHGEVRQYNIDLYGVEGCDYLLKNYEVRFIERKEEIDSLKEAEAILGAGGGDPKMAAATGQNAPHEGENMQYEPTEDGVVAEGDVEHNGKEPDHEKATIHMAGGTQNVETNF